MLSGSVHVIHVIHHGGGGGGGGGYHSWSPELLTVDGNESYNTNPLWPLVIHRFRVDNWVWRVFLQASKLESVSSTSSPNY